MKVAPQNHLKPDEQFIGRVDTPYGVLLIKRGDALDQARMRATQLTSLLAIIQSDDIETFRALRVDLQDSIVWMALQAAQDMAKLVELAVEDAKAGAA